MALGPGAIANLHTWGCITMNFISPGFSSADMHGGWLGSGRVCACLGAAGPSSPWAPAASCCTESQAAAEQEGQGSAFIASPPTEESFASHWGREVFAWEVPGQAREALQGLHGLGPACSVSRMCWHMEQSVSAVLPGKHPKKVVLCSPSPISQETKGLLHTDLLWPVTPPHPSTRNRDEMFRRCRKWNRSAEISAHLLPKAVEHLRVMV